jgi:1-acyl-sn-glycerol-3-phosphate acyltransferase
VIVVQREAPPTAAQILDAFAALREQARVQVRPNSLAARDVAFVQRLRPLLDGLYDYYFRCETELECEVPDGPLLAVANHNGMSGVPDMFCHFAAFWRRYGVDRRAYGLMHDFPFRAPAAGAWLNSCGAIAANPKNAHAALDSGATLIVFPGGDIDACRPFRKRYQIELAGRHGFIRLALRAQVPVMPIVSVGGHHSLYLISDGQGVARALRLPQLFRSNVFPIGFALPYGLIVGTPLPHLPPPVKIHTRMLRPIHFGLPRSAADDPEAVATCFERVREAMQAAMDELRREGRHGLLPRGGGASWWKRIAGRAAEPQVQREQEPRWQARL